MTHCATKFFSYTVRVGGQCLPCASLRKKCECGGDGTCHCGKSGSRPAKGWTAGDAMDARHGTAVRLNSRDCGCKRGMR
jgi:hypothetical protein